MSPVTNGGIPSVVQHGCGVFLGESLVLVLRSRAIHEPTRVLPVIHPLAPTSVGLERLYYGCSHSSVCDVQLGVNIRVAEAFGLEGAFHDVLVGNY